MEGNEQYFLYSYTIFHPSSTSSLTHNTILSYHTIPLHYTYTPYLYTLASLPPYHTNIKYYSIAVFLYLCTYIIYLQIITLYLYTIPIHYTALFQHLFYTTLKIVQNSVLCPSFLPYPLYLQSLPLFYTKLSDWLSCDLLFIQYRLKVND